MPAVARLGVFARGPHVAGNPVVVLANTFAGTCVVNRQRAQERSHWWSAVSPHLLPLRNLAGSSVWGHLPTPFWSVSEQDPRACRLLRPGLRRVRAVLKEHPYLEPGLHWLLMCTPNWTGVVALISSDGTSITRGTLTCERTGGLNKEGGGSCDVVRRVDWGSILPRCAPRRG